MYVLPMPITRVGREYVYTISWSLLRIYVHLSILGYEVVNYILMIPILPLCLSCIDHQGCDHLQSLYRTATIKS